MSGKKGLTPTYMHYQNEDGSTGAEIRGVSTVATGAVTTTEPVNVSFLDNIAFQVNLYGSNGGAQFAIQTSLDYVPLNQSRAPNPGTWQFYTTSPFPLTISAGDTQQMDVNQLAAPYVRAVVASTFIEGGTITTVADVAGSLNSTYFLLGVPNDSSTQTKYIWFNVDGGGVDPMVPGAIGIEVDITSGDTADAVATATEAAIASQVNSSPPGANVITFTQLGAGSGFVEDSIPAPTGFIFTYTATNATLDILVSGKGL